ncbi:MAG: TetR/AcrR family transcriptional regulator [Gemmatimonadaceae bacterium]
MSPRPRRLPDSAILDAAAKVVNRTGPERFTLADVGGEVGLSAATLVQRFGSKRALLLAMLEQTISLLDENFEAAFANTGSPLEGLYAAAVGRTSQFDAPESLANRLAFVLLEMNDPEFHSLAVESSRKAVNAYKIMLDNASDVGELSNAGADTQALAESIHAMTLGSLMMWAITREGDRPPTRRDLDNLLRPFKSAPNRAAATRDTHGPKLKASAPAC